MLIQKTKKFLTKLNKDIFIISIISYGIFFFLELAKPKFVLAYFNLNYLLLICLISGILSILTEEQQQEKVEAADKQIDVKILAIISIVVFAAIMLFVKDLGIWGIIIGFSGGVVSFIIGEILNDRYD